MYFCPTFSGSLPVYRRVGKYVGKYAGKYVGKYVGKYAGSRGAIVRRYFNGAVQ